MKKPKNKLPKPRLPKVPAALRRRKAPEERVNEALQNVPRITNETVAEHREEVLSSARKYIYPLQHSKHRVVRLSIAIFVTVLVLFFVVCTVSIYKFQNTSGFIYGVSKVIPFPIAKVGPSWVSYESYLFELRRNMHYYHTQQSVNFADKVGKSQLVRLKQQAMAQVILDAEVKQLAAKNHVSVSSKTVNDQIILVKQQNRLGSSDRVFREVLNKFWGWSEADFHRELKQQLLQQAVVAKLDTSANTKAQTALTQLQNGGDFTVVAGAFSDDTATKPSGGQYGVPITPNFANLSPVITNELFKLQPGQISGIVNTGYTLEILKVIDGDKASVHAAHIQIKLQPITVYVKPLEVKNKPHQLIRL